METLWQNPELQRHVRGRLRKGRIVGGLVFYIGILLLLIYVSLQMHQGDLPILGRVLYFLLLGAQFFVSYIVGTVTCAGSIASEREKQSYDLIRMVPARPYHMALGRLLGTPILSYLLMAITLPVSLLCLLVGGIDLGLFLSTQCVLLAGGLGIHSVGLLISAQAPRAQAANALALITLFIFAGIFSLPQLNFLHPMTYLSLADKQHVLSEVTFFGWALPHPVMAVGVSLFLVIWGLIGVARNLEQEDNRAFSRGQSVVFYASFSFLLTGLFWKNLTDLPLSNETWIASSAAIGVLLGSAMLLMGLQLPDYEGHTRWLYQQKSALHWRNWLHEDAPIIGFSGLLWLVLGSVLLLITGLAAPNLKLEFLIAWGVCGLFLGTYSLLGQLIHTWWSPFNRQALLGVIVLLSLLIPIFPKDPGLAFPLNPFFLLLWLGETTATANWLLLGSLVTVGCIGGGLWLAWQRRITHLRAKVLASLPPSA
jgi:hypothetical protein